MERRLLTIGRNSAGWRRLPSLAAIWPLPKPADPPTPVECTRAQHPARPSLSTCAAARRLSGAASHSIQGIEQCQAAVASYVHCVEYVGPCDNALNVSIRVHPVNAASKPNKRNHTTCNRCLGDGPPMLLWFLKIQQLRLDHARP